MNTADIDNIFLYHLIDRIPHYIFWKDKNLVFRGCNKKFAQQFGYNDAEEIIGKTDDDFPWNSSLRNKYTGDDKKILQSGIPKLDYEEKQKQADGSTRTLLVSKVPICDKKHEIIGVLGIYADITKIKETEKKLKKAKEQAEKANKLKSEFISNMEHDLRTPSSGIMGMTKILEERETDSSKKEALHMLSQASERLLNILNGILAFDKAEAGIIPTTDQEFSIKKTVDDILAMEQPYVVSKKLELTAKYDKGIPEIIVGDEQRIFRILLNLIGNAVKFTKKGHITIYIKVPKIIDQQNIILQLIVEDTGIGIPKDKIKDIFERFVRGTLSNQGIYEGSGLGLSVVKQFIEDMDGKIDVESVVDKGTKFTCNIPVKLPLPGNKSTKIKPTKTKKAKVIKKPEQKTKAIKNPKSLKAAKLTKQKIKVLLVEDDILAQTMASDIIKENLTNNLDVADSGEEAIKFMDKNKYDLIFMDIGLPDINGCDVARKIRRSKTNRNQKTVIVALTAHASSKAKKKCFGAQINHFLTKPIDINKIKEVLRKLLFEETTKTKKIGKPSKFEISEKIPTNSDLLKIEGEVIDLKLGMEKLNCDAEQAKKTIELFIKILKKEMPQLIKAKDKSDWQTVKDFAHKHRGGSLYCGVPRLQQAFTNLEHYLITEKTELREQLYQQLLDEIDKLYKAYINKL